MESRSEQTRRREKHLAAALKRREQNLSQQGGADFLETIHVVRATRQSEIDQMQAGRHPDEEEIENQLRENAFPQLAQVGVKGREVTLALTDSLDAANTDVPYRDKVEALVECVYQQLPKETFCQLLFELLKPDSATNQKPEHLIEAIRWLVRSGQGSIEFRHMDTNPEDRCAQYLSGDRSIMFCEFADMDASAYPSLIHVQNIGRVAVCKRAWKNGSTQHQSPDEGYTIPSLQVGQKMIIAQVPACNPVARRTQNLEVVHKTNFVLVRLILEECGNEDRNADLVESQLSLVEYSLLPICTPEEEHHIRRTLVWEEEGESTTELTNAGIVASNLLGTPASGTDSFVVNQGDVTIVSFVTSEENREETPDERLEREERLQNEGEETPVDDDMEVYDFGATQVRSTTVVNPIVQNFQMPPGAEIPVDVEDLAWGALEKADGDQIYLHQLIRTLRRNATYMNPVDMLEAKRMLEQTASKGSAVAQTALRLLAPTLSSVQEDLVICRICAWGANPGVQHCPRCTTAFTTMHSRTQGMVEGGAGTLLADAAVCCLERVRDSNPDTIEETGRQPVDMDGNFPQKCRPGQFCPEILNITHFASANCSEHIQAEEPPPLNPKRAGLQGSFRYLAKGQGKSKAIIDETQQQQIERERKKSEAAAMEEFGKSIGSGFVGPADRQFQRVLRDGGSESAALLDHVNRRRAIFSPDDVQKMPKSIQEWESNKAR